jgi:hypothetical protein
MEPTFLKEEREVFEKDLFLLQWYQRLAKEEVYQHQ